MKLRFLVLVAFFLPAMTHAEVIFSEIAWMGTATDANDEWIEIYNFSSTPQNLSGWALTDGNTLNIVLSGTMPPHGVFVLERTDDNTLPSITADIIYTGALSNSGATLTIKDAGGTIIDQVVGGENWEKIGGSNELKYTPQLTMSGTWVTGTPTPGAPNIEENELPDEAELASKSRTKSGGGGPVKVKPRTVSAPMEQDLVLSLSAPEVAYVHEEVVLEPLPEGVGTVTENSLKYYWNFGDLSTATGKRQVHRYKYPGEYTIAVAAEFGEQKAEVLHEIRILPTSLSMTENERGDVILKNNGTQEMDLHNFTIRGIEAFTFPRLSILKGGGTLMVPKEKFGGYRGTLVLQDSQKTPVFSLSSSQSPMALEVPRTQPVVSYQRAETNIVQNTEADEEVAGAAAGETVIRIGSTESEEKEGIFARIVKKLGSLLRL